MDDQRRVVGAFPDGNSALMLVAARLRHVASTRWSPKRCLQMDRLTKLVAIALTFCSGPNEARVDRLLSLKRRMNASDDDWMFRNRIKKAGKMKPGPIWHEHVLGRHIQPVADRLSLPHITWRLRRHWGATQMIGNKVDVKVVQERLGHSRASTTMNYYAHVLDERADGAAELLSGHWDGRFRLNLLPIRWTYDDDV